MEKIQDKTYNQHVKMDLDRHSENNIGNVRGGKT